MRIVVTGLECSGTKWVASLLAKHPDVEGVVHTSIPEYYMPDTRWPNLAQGDVVVWVVRYELARGRSVETNNYNWSRPPDFLPPQVYENCKDLFYGNESVLFVGYESLVGPLGQLVLLDLLLRLKLQPQDFPWDSFNPVDGNQKYFK